MWLVLCSQNDVAARWAYNGLQARGLAPLELVFSESLAHSVHWEHRLGVDGFSIKIVLADSRIIDSAAVQGVLNRIPSLPSEHLLVAHASDRDYAVQELTAFYLSWLFALPGPVLNRPTPQGLLGQWRHESEWMWLASETGLPTSNYRLSSYAYQETTELSRAHNPMGTPRHTVIVVVGNVVGAPMPSDIRDGCRRLAERSGTALLGVDFVSDPTGAWTFASATPLPDLRLGGQALLNALASVLRGGNGEGR